jgi:catechol 2,3-dioxygenase-like lactoylglutathione lyase family enzyme
MLPVVAAAADNAKPGQTPLIYGEPTGMAWLEAPKSENPVPIKPNSAGVIGLEHTHVITDNLERSLHFYVDLMGFKQVMAIQDISKDPPMNALMNTLLGFKGATFRHAIVEMPGGASYSTHVPQIEFWEVHGVPVDDSLKKDPTKFLLGKGYNSYVVKDLDALLARMKAAGIRFVSEKLSDSDGSGNGGVYVVDPDGQIIELNQESDEQMQY